MLSGKLFINKFKIIIKIKRRIDWFKNKINTIFLSKYFLKFTYMNFNSILSLRIFTLCLNCPNYLLCQIKSFFIELFFSLLSPIIYPLCFIIYLSFKCLLKFKPFSHLVKNYLKNYFFVFLILICSYCVSYNKSIIFRKYKYNFEIKKWKFMEEEIRTEV